MPRKLRLAHLTEDTLLGGDEIRAFPMSPCGPDVHRPYQATANGTAPARMLGDNVAPLHGRVSFQITNFHVSNRLLLAPHWSDVYGTVPSGVYIVQPLQAREISADSAADWWVRIHPDDDTGNDTPYEIVEHGYTWLAPIPRDSEATAPPPGGE